MGLELRKINIGKEYYDAATYEEYNANPNIYDSRHTAIIDEEAGVVLPLLTKTNAAENNVGILYGGMVSLYNYPQTASEQQQYSIDNMIDMSNPANYKELIKTSQQLKDVEREILLNVDNVTRPVITENDTPAMTGMKKAIIAKNCDIHSYSHRFGPNYPNDIRILKENDLSLKKLIKFGDSLDMKVDITFSDRNPDVPNPMGTPITVTITSTGANGGFENEDN